MLYSYVGLLFDLPDISRVQNYFKMKELECEKFSGWEVEIGAKKGARLMV